MRTTTLIGQFCTYQRNHQSNTWEIGSEDVADLFHHLNNNIKGIGTMRRNVTQAAK